MGRPIVAFDEAGNTGQNLVDASQPVFVLASVNFDNQETEELMDILAPRKGQEVHFQRFSKSDSGKGRILEFLQSDLISPEKVKISIYHKRYMIVTKFVDLLVENMFHEVGFDLYKKGANIAMSNMYYMCTPSFCGKKNFQTFLERFVDMVRKKDAGSIDNFYRSVSRLQAACKGREFKEELCHIMLTKEIIYDVIGLWDTHTLDPAIPALVYDCAEWGRELDCQFDLVHDRSKAIEYWEEIFSYLRASDEPNVIIGYDRRKMALPLKAAELRFCDSKVICELQLADILAGACAYWVKGLCDVKFKKPFFEPLNGSKLMSLIYHVVWPSADVTPKDLGTNEEGGINPADYTAALISRQSKKRRRNTNG